MNRSFLDIQYELNPNIEKLSNEDFFKFLQLLNIGIYIPLYNDPRLKIFEELKQKDILVIKHKQ